MSSELTAARRREVDARLDEVVRELRAARAADDHGRVNELELEELELLDVTAEPTTTTEEQFRERRQASGVDDGIDARPVRRPNVRDSFHPSGWYRPRFEHRRLRPRRAPLAEALHRRVSRRAPRPRRVAGSRSSSKDPPSPSGPELARQLYGAARCWFDAMGIWPWSGWKRLAAEARAERDREWMRLAAREAGFVHVSELVEVELDRLGSLR
jgi:hypothetical protein